MTKKTFATEKDIVNHLFFDTYKVSFRLCEPMQVSDFYGIEFHQKFGKCCKAIDKENSSISGYHTALPYFAELQPDPLLPEHPLFHQYGAGPPGPYVPGPSIHGKMYYMPGDIFTFTVTLTGSECHKEHLWYRLIKKLENFGAGKTKSTWQFVGWEKIVHYAPDETHSVIKKEHITTKQLTVLFETPMDLKNKPEDYSTLTFADFYHWVFRRLYHLTYLYCGPMEFKNSEIYFRSKTGIKTSNVNIKLVTFSYTTGGHVKLKHCIIGEINFTGDFTQYLPLLQIGQYLHIGGSTSFGFGKYTLKMST